MGNRTLPERIEQIKVRKICMIKPSALGDIVQTLPLLSVLKHRFPKASISWVANHGLAGLLINHPHIDEVIPFHRHGKLRDWKALLARLRAANFDLVFDLQGLLRTGVMTMATRAPLRVGLETAREWSSLACHLLLPDTSKQVPAHRRYWRVAEELGMGESQIHAGLHISNKAQNWATETLGPYRSLPILAVQAGAKWATKRWPVESFSTVLGHAIKEFQPLVVLLGSQDESELNSQLFKSIRRHSPAENVKNLCGKTNLQQLAAILHQSDLMLTNDSGPMHLAAALQTPVVGLFTCTSSVISGPPGTHHELIQAQVPCAASYKKKCPQSGDAHYCCMRQLSEHQVWSVLKRKMSQLIPQENVA